LTALARQVVLGHGGVAWVQGEPGIGKSTLVDAVVAGALASGCKVSRGAGDELMQAFPLRLMAECLGVSGTSSDPARAEIARLLRGEASPTTTVDQVSAAGERLLELVDWICAAGPLVLVAEDLHWADEPSLLMWNKLARAVDQIPLLLVGTCRPVPHRATVERVRAATRERADAYLELRPLDHDDVVQIAGQLAAGTPGPRLSAELVRAGGNPLYVRELVEALVRDGLVEVVDAVAELRVAAGATPTSLTAAVARRLGFLTHRTVKVLRMAALLGHEFDVGYWCVVTDRPASELADAAKEAVAAGVLSEDGEWLVFRNDVIRQALVDQISPPVQACLHRQAAQLLAQAGAGVEVVARHLIAAPGSVDGWVVDWLAQSPEPMLDVVPEVSAELLTRAVDRLEPRDQRWELLATRLARVLFRLGRGEQAYELAGALVRHTTDVELSTELRILMLRSASMARRLEEAAAAAEPSVVNGRIPLTWRARLSAWSAVVLADLGQYEQARARARDALQDAQRSADPLSIGCAWHALSYIAEGHWQIPHIRDALAALGDDPESVDLRTCLLIDLHHLSMTENADDAMAAIGEALVVAEGIGTVRLGHVIGEAAAACYYYGRWDEALLHIDGVSPEHMNHPNFVHLVGLAALVCLHREDHEGAQARLQTAGLVGTADALLSAYPWAHYMPEALATCQEARGDLDRALAIRSTWLDLPSSTIRARRCDEALYLVRLALTAGDARTARAAADAVQPDAEAAPNHLLAARCCRALVDGDTGELLDVAKEYGRLGWPLHIAFALEEAADRLAQHGQVTAARAALNDAVRTYDDLGATWDIRRIDARLRRHGIRRGSRTIRRDDATGWDALTPGETRVASLVAEGLSNPAIAATLFLSRNTVQTHVSRILTKLQLRSRVELIQQLAGRTNGDRA
jgi:DNA-binding CsgD family transcriptional regulator/tetratricopeptide (TPR) repeat protein